MILILGGTTEGRKAIQVADEANKPYFYSTVSKMQAIDSTYAIRLAGAMREEEMEQFCRENRISLLIDAAHPFAIQLHATVATVATRLSLPVIRFERLYPVRDTAFIWCSGYDEAIQRLQADGIKNLLALTGVKTISKLRGYWQQTPCWFRILDREESIDLAVKSGFPPERLVFFHEGEEEKILLDKLHPDAILTKESGESGLFNEKTEAARQAGIPVYVVCRPALPDTFITVNNTENLRKEIYRLLPGFLPLRSGYTTGACATAASKAALYALLGKLEQTESSITLPSGQIITLPVAHTEWTANSARCTVIKNAGDDPDVTNGCQIIAEVELSPSTLSSSTESTENAGTPSILFKAGEGVGTVTLPGLGLEIGGPAINMTPRRLITSELTTVLQQSHPRFNGQITVTLSVPGGRELAKRTFNPKLGIEGGISIIGTSGIVRPFSNEAFIASIRKEAEVAKAIGCETLVINSGAKSERFLKNYIAQHEAAGLPPQAFIHYGNFIGETIRIAANLHFPKLILGIMLGKAVKLAEGALDTHSKKVVMNKEFLKELATEAGCSPVSLEQIERLTLARELWQSFSTPDQSRFFPLLLQKCYAHCSPLFPEGKLSILLLTEEGEIPYRI